MANDEDEWVLPTVAKNRNTPDFVLRRLAKSRFTSVLVQLAQNPSTPSDALTELAQNDDTAILMSIYNHPNLPQEALDITSKKLKIAYGKIT